MKAANKANRLILLVEDNEADAELTREYLAQHAGERYVVHHVTLFADALAMLQTLKVDAVLLDLFVPDALTTEGVRAIRQIAGDVPVLMLTGLGDEEVALECLNAGAQDFVCKEELSTAALARAIERSLARQKAGEFLTAHQLLARERRVAAGGILAALDGGPAAPGGLPLCQRHPAAFVDFVDEYGALLAVYADDAGTPGQAFAAAMTASIATFGQLGGGARDLMDVHMAILARLPQDALGAEHRPLVLEGRLFALEMMGLLTEFYRRGVGTPQPHRAIA